MSHRHFLANQSKYMFNCSLKITLCTRISSSKYCESFTSASLPISQKCSIMSLKNRINQMRTTFVNLCLGLLLEYIIKLEYFLIFSLSLDGYCIEVAYIDNRLDIFGLIWFVIFLEGWSDPDGDVKFLSCIWFHIIVITWFYQNFNLYNYCNIIFFIQIL